MFSLRLEQIWNAPQRTLQYSARCVPQMGPGADPCNVLIWNEFRKRKNGTMACGLPKRRQSAD